MPGNSQSKLKIAGKGSGKSLGKSLNKSMRKTVEKTLTKSIRSNLAKSPNQTQENASKLSAESESGHASGHASGLASGLGAGSKREARFRDVRKSSASKKEPARRLLASATKAVVRKGKGSSARKVSAQRGFDSVASTAQSSEIKNEFGKCADAGAIVEVRESAGAGSISAQSETQLEMPFLNDVAVAELAPSQLELLLRATAALRSAVVAVSEAVSEAVVREQSLRAVADDSRLEQMNLINQVASHLAPAQELPPELALSPSTSPVTAPVAAPVAAPVVLPEIPSFALEPLSNAADPRALNLDKAARETEVAADWVELYPQGISVTSTVGRPVLVMKDQRGVEVLPVWMNPLDAGIAIAELTTSSGATPHMVTRRMMEALKIRAVRCSFVELLGHHQYVIVEFEGSSELKAIRVRADEAMSFCVQARVKFQATRAFMRMCRDVDADMERLENGNSSANAPGANYQSENSSKKHPYVI